ncbi:MAG: hypothetical protein NZL88_11865, partial [Gaiellaceae bacterium]|nr:hypothetical protein [Gaiellaceae bacterium]
MRYALVSARSTPTNEALAAARLEDGVRWEPMTPAAALRVLRAGDVALGRLDVLPTLDGVDDGLWALGALAARGHNVEVFCRVSAPREPEYTVHHERVGSITVRRVVNDLTDVAQ